MFADRNEPRLAYNGLTLDRAAAQRGDPAWVETVLGGPSARLIPFWGEKCLVRGTASAGHQPVMLPGPAAAGPGPSGVAGPGLSGVAGPGLSGVAGRGLSGVAGPGLSAAAVLAVAADPVLLGLDGGAGVFAVDLSGLDLDEALRLTGAADAVDVRAMFATLGAQQAATLGYALGILRWHRDQRFCAACGHQAVSWRGGTQRRCLGPDCGRLLFPRIEPAVIALVEAPGEPSRCLLARHRGAAPGAFATLAGFVEIGESLEDAVRREVAEETGVELGEVSYQASQAWPFPAGLMIGFRARASSASIRVDRAELDEASWFTRAEVSAMLERHPARCDSIESHLIGTWLREPG